MVKSVSKCSLFSYILDWTCQSEKWHQKLLTKMYTKLYVIFNSPDGVHLVLTILRTILLNV